ncbi:uncharacterized protein LOC103722254 [Phoenix dactylifera]|uniref:Uncharacterized protein LOC103722254 n=1 Tax=Phoenix dactylifera TaxID=42345 RepID=A0A8B7D0X6_PHODC|nr:uncharacterized protein LOC103722254 [Phoenix dactylifera]
MQAPTCIHKRAILKKDWVQARFFSFIKIQASSLRPWKSSESSHLQMGRWVRPEVYPLMAAMAFVTGMCAFQLTRNMILNPDVRINKARRASAILDNAEEGEKYSQHSFRKFLYRQRSAVMPALDGLSTDSDK